MMQMRLRLAITNRHLVAPCTGSVERATVDHRTRRFLFTERIAARYRFACQRAAVIIAMICVLVPASAQICGFAWLPGHGVPGVAGSVDAITMWDADGAGPESPRLVAAGNFSIAGTSMVRNIAVWDGHEWSPLGTGAPNGEVHALAVLPNGDLVAGGQFTTPGLGVVRWDGSAWTAMSSGLPGVLSLAVLADGTLVAGGYFFGTYRWNGTRWIPFGPDNFRIRALVPLPDGGLLAGGQRVSHWDGSVWTPLGDGLLYEVHALTVMPDQSIVAAGTFTTADGVPANRVARWDGTAWSPMGTGLEFNYPRDLVVMPDGSLIAVGGNSMPVGITSGHMTRWNGVSWTEIPSGMNSYANSIMLLDNGDLVVGGSFVTTLDAPARSIARLDHATQTWASFGTGTNALIQAMALHPSGDLLIGGRFTSVEGVPANRIARWNGEEWSPLGSGIDGAGVHSGVMAITVLRCGDIVAGGTFTTAGGTPITGIARWNGTRWSMLGSGIADGGHVRAVAELPSGDLVATGWFPTADGVVVNHIARWDGIKWHALGTGLTSVGTSSRGLALAVLPNSDLVVGGQFESTGGLSTRNIARWNGTQWLPGSGTEGGSESQVNSLIVLPNGDLVAGGTFTSMGGVTVANVARWDGSSWSRLGSLPPNTYTLVRFANGDIGASGSFGTIMRWDGSAWQALAPGLNSSVYTLAALPNGDLYVGGNATRAGHQPSAYLARWVCQPRACPPDYNNDSVVDSRDFSEYLSAFLAGSPAADFNMDAATNTQDFFDFLDLFFAGC